MVPGRLTNVGAADIHTGGAVSNTGLAMKFFGADTVLMGKIGDDAFGRMVLDIYRRHGVEGGMIVSQDTTSYSVVVAVPAATGSSYITPEQTIRSVVRILTFQTFGRHIVPFRVSASNEKHV